MDTPLKSTLKHSKPKISIIIRKKTQTDAMQQNRLVVKLPTIKRKLISIKELYRSNGQSSITVPSPSFFPQRRICKKWSRSSNCVSEQLNKTPTETRNHSRIFYFPSIESLGKDQETLKPKPIHNLLQKKITYKFKSIVKRHRFLKFIQTSFYKYIETTPKQHNIFHNHAPIK